ncbi:MAG TPA: N-acetylmuramoyl-L-alanine amidase [Candidatus Janibacter merdipullorum]|nr:N-acetylmuramoyl-L-alanine amidase [Candidatus Janibacter merdipullorum]
MNPIPCESLVSPLRRTCARVVPVALTASLLTITPLAPSGAAPAESVPTQRDSISIDPADGTTEQLDTQDFRVAGVTWQGDRSDVEVQLRTRDAETGSWTDWSLLQPEEGPDAGTAEAATVRGGTQPLIAAPSDGIQVRIDSEGATPSEVEVDLIDPGTSPADSSAAPTEAPQTTGSASATAARPTINSRAAWGADESIRRGDPSYGEVRGAVVHHTAGVNAYTQAEVPAILRGIYEYHVKSRGWDDIGYNVLVDKWGRLWEGRHGGLDKAVVGAHAAGANDDAVGISAMGNYDTANAPGSMTASIERYLAWKLDVHGVDATGQATIGGQWHHTIIGHRSVGQTECPGQNIAAKLWDIRRGAKERQS